RSVFGLVELALGVRHTAGGLVGATQVIVCLAKTRGNLYSTFQGANGILVALLVEVHLAQRFLTLSVIRVDRDGALEIGEGLAQVTLLQFHGAEIVRCRE